MRYNKSDFTLVPSRQARIGMPANQQVVYMWLCEHSDDKNECYPSRKVLAYECGMSPSTLDRAVIELEKKGYIIRQSRYNENKQITNLYTILIVTKGSQIDEPISVPTPLVNMTTPPIHIDEQNSTHLTQPIINTTNVVLAKAENKSSEAINELFLYWHEKTGIAIQSQVRANRFACSNLLKRYSTDQVHQLIDGVVKAQADRYAPRIADFRDLQSKLNQLLAWGKSQATTKKGTIKI